MYFDGQGSVKNNIFWGNKAMVGTHKALNLCDPLPDLRRLNLPPGTANGPPAPALVPAIGKHLFRTVTLAEVHSYTCEVSYPSDHPANVLLASDEPILACYTDLRQAFCCQWWHRLRKQPTNTMCCLHHQSWGGGARPRPPLQWQGDPPRPPIGVIVQQAPWMRWK